MAEEVTSPRKVLLTLLDTQPVFRHIKIKKPQVHFIIKNIFDRKLIINDVVNY